MAEFDKGAVPIGYVHATVTLSGEAKLLAAELERLRVAGLIDRASLEVVVPRSRIDATPEIKRLPAIRQGEFTGQAELGSVESRLDDRRFGFVADMIRRFEVITTD